MFDEYEKNISIFEKEYNEAYGDKNDFVTIGWLKMVANNEPWMSIDALNYGINYLAEKLRIYEGIKLTDSLILQRQHYWVILYGTCKYYENNPFLIKKVNTYIYNYNYYNENKKNNISIKSMILAIFIATMSSISTQIALDTYEVGKKYISQEVINNINEFDNKLKQLEVVTVYEDNDQNSQSIIYGIENVQIDLINEDDDWYYVSIYNDNNISLGYIVKSDLDKK